MDIFPESATEGLPFLRVDVASQRMDFYPACSRSADGLLRLPAEAERSYVISTAALGVGTEPGSYKTPPGLHRVAQKFGAGLPLGAVLKSRQWTGGVWSPGDPYHEAADLILSRILWLEGTTEANRTSFDRYIYIHGTNHENKLGTPCSHGCVRMSNAEVVELFERVPVGTLVEIRAEPDAAIV